MCGLCGIFGESADWSQGAAQTEAGQSADPVARRRVRTQRIALLNRLLRPLNLTVSDWQGSQYLVSTATGKTLLAMNLPDIWRAVAELTGSPFDPLGQEGAEPPAQAIR